MREERIQLDPGIGFGKTLEHNLELLRAARRARPTLGRPLVIGTSRKSFLGRLTGRDVTERVHGTVATCVIALERGARVFRVHDVAATRDALEVAAATFARMADEPEDYDDDDLTTTTTTRRAPRSGSPSRSSGCRSTRTTASPPTSARSASGSCSTSASTSASPTR